MMVSMPDGRRMNSISDVLYRETTAGVKVRGIFYALFGILNRPGTLDGIILLR